MATSEVLRVLNLDEVIKRLFFNHKSYYGSEEKWESAKKEKGKESDFAFLLKNGAYTVAKLFEKDKKPKSTQFRKFYEEVIKLRNRGQRYKNDQKGFNTFIKPPLNLLYSKIYYAVERNLAGPTFKRVMEKSLDRIDSQEELERFTLFMEAIIGFMKKN